VPVPIFWHVTGDEETWLAEGNYQLEES